MSQPILCVIDPTTSVQPALHRAAWLAQKLARPINLFICYFDEHLSGQRFYDAPSLASARGSVLDEKKAYLDELAAPLRESGIDVSTSVSWDQPLHEGILRHAEGIDAALVMKDTHHHSALQRAFFGHTDWNLIRECPIPLWLVQPRDVKASPVILAAIDPAHRNDKPASMDNRILAVSQKLGAATDGIIHAFHCYDPRIALATATANAYLPVSLPLAEVEKDMRERHLERFEEVIDFLGIPDDRKHLVCGAAHEMLPELASSVDADVVVMGAIARNAVKRMYIGSTAERTLEQLPCDMLIIKPDWFGPDATLSADASKSPQPATIAS